MMAAWKARLKGYWCALQSAVSKLIETADGLVESKAERDRQRSAEDRGSLVKVIPFSQLEPTLTELVQQEPVLCVVEQALANHAVLQTMLRLVEPCGAVILLSGNDFQSSMLVEQTIASCVVAGASLKRIYLKMPGTHGTATVLMSHGTIEAAQAASSLLSSILSSSGVVSGVAWQLMHG